VNIHLGKEVEACTCSNLALGREKWSASYPTCFNHVVHTAQRAGRVPDTVNAVGETNTTVPTTNKWPLTLGDYTILGCHSAPAHINYMQKQTKQSDLLGFDAVSQG